jgi:adenylate cyclase
VNAGNPAVIRVVVEQVQKVHVTLRSLHRPFLAKSPAVSDLHHLRRRVDGPLGRRANALEISRSNRVPHLSVCGGQALCSTCRVEIVAGGETLDSPAEAELRLLRLIGAPSKVRLACQIRPKSSMTVARVLKPEEHAITPRGAVIVEAAGVDREAAILFVDIRGFTRLSQTKLAYDVVHILNSFFAGVGRSIETAGGRVDKYIGDGVMAVFEHPEGLSGAARAAIGAVVAIDRGLAAINAGEIAEPLRLAMGLHVGRLVFGRIGWGAAALPTVIGPAVNVASRLESLAKAREVELALSGECATAAGLAVGALTMEDVDIRGLEVAFSVVLVWRVADLAPSWAGWRDNQQP